MTDTEQQAIARLKESKAKAEKQLFSAGEDAGAQYVLHDQRVQPIGRRAELLPSPQQEVKAGLHDKGIKKGKRGKTKTYSLKPL